MHGLLMVSSAHMVSSCKLISVCARVLALSTNPEKKKRWTTHTVLCLSFDDEIFMATHFKIIILIDMFSIFGAVYFYLSME